MMAKTKSEALFETFCDLNRIAYIRISTGDAKTPDYCITVKSKRVVVEVKQVDPNPEEKRKEKEMEETPGEPVVIGGTPGERVRKKINDAGPQISRIAKGKFPSLLVLFNNVLLYNSVPFWDPIEPYDVLVGMYGLETYVMSKSTFSVKRIRFGPKRKMSREHNTSISAVAILKVDSAENPVMDIYHNIFAKIALDSDIFKGFPCKQYTIKGNDKFLEWVEIVV